MLINFNDSSFSHRYFLFILLSLSYFSGYANTRTDTLNFFGSKPAKQDTLYSLNALRNFNWHITVYNKDGNVNSFNTSSIDTFFFRRHEPEAFLLSTTFLVDSNMLNRVKYLFYSTTGSVKVLLNTTTLTSDGVFNNSVKYTDLQALKDNY